MTNAPISLADRRRSAQAQADEDDLVTIELPAIVIPRAPAVLLHVFMEAPRTANPAEHAAWVSEMIARLILLGLDAYLLGTTERQI